ncbi:hypothetical protein [Micavibrio aeruginosavorus]|uniref:Uncharacterized protein n=1 Tax=Micavibrio aeruginosavorus (strain ARL-13) TaxID=856793 RepID=G2KMV9_MICAA|nr:hypothetical protein [Micavibrio aeruginosavorus]AEP08891.1 hypothetical protein MICA_554 [Micavibrio aeruginosavorus ARL-13]
MTGCRIGKVTPKLSVVEPMPYPINYDAVRYLTQALEQAKTGEFRSIAIAGINAQGYVQTAYSISPDENPVLLHGACGWLSKRVMDEVQKSA